MGAQVFGLRSTRIVLTLAVHARCRRSLTMPQGDLVPYVNTWMWPSLTLVGSSSLFFGIYIGKITNSHEWKEIFLDYCHHKRTTHSPNPLDKVARVFLRMLKIAPK